MPVLKLLQVDDSPIAFCLWVVGLSLPIYVLGAVAPQLSRWLPLELPAFVLMFALPAAVALGLRYREAGSAGVTWLLRRLVAPVYPKQLPWLVLSLVTVPITVALALGVQQLFGQPVPTLAVPFGSLLFAFVVYFFGAIGEELGWTGYATDPLRERYGFLGASLGLGAVWWLWHVVPYALLGRPLGWILWQGLATLLFRVVMVWLYTKSGRHVLSAILFHTMINVSTFPTVSSTYYQPSTTSLVLLALVIAVALKPRALQTKSRTSASP